MEGDANLARPPEGEDIATVQEWADGLLRYMRMRARMNGGMNNAGPTGGMNNAGPDEGMNNAGPDGGMNNARPEMVMETERQRLTNYLGSSPVLSDILRDMVRQGGVDEDSLQDYSTMSGGNSNQGSSGSRTRRSTSSNDSPSQEMMTDEPAPSSSSSDGLRTSAASASSSTALAQASSGGSSYPVSTRNTTNNTQTTSTNDSGSDSGAKQSIGTQTETGSAKNSRERARAPSSESDRMAIEGQAASSSDGSNNAGTGTAGKGTAAHKEREAPADAENDTEDRPHRLRRRLRLHDHEAPPAQGLPKTSLADRGGDWCPEWRLSEDEPKSKIAAQRTTEASSSSSAEFTQATAGIQTSASSGSGKQSAGTQTDSGSDAKSRNCPGVSSSESDRNALDVETSNTWDTTNMQDSSVPVEVMSRLSSETTRRPGAARRRTADCRGAGRPAPLSTQQGGQGPHVEAQDSQGPHTDPWSGWVTSLTVRNVPKSYTQEDLLRAWPSDGTYDFLHLRFTNSHTWDSRVRIVIVNFVTPQYAASFRKRWQGEVLCQETDVLSIATSSVQGRDANLMLVMDGTPNLPAVFVGEKRLSDEQARGLIRLSKEGTFVSDI